nr:MAG: hypothetical protein [Marsupenaeus japonicus endogenous nimavirus]
MSLPNDNEKFVNTLLDVHSLLSEECHHSDDWKTDFEKSIYGDLRALDASSLFESLLNFLIDDKIDHTIKKEVDDPSYGTNRETGYDDIDKLFGLDVDNYDVKTLVIGEMLRHENHRKTLGVQITHGNKYAALFTTIVNIMYRYLKLSKIIWMQFWGVTKIGDIFNNRILNQEENEERIEARKKAIKNINDIITQQQKCKKKSDQSEGIVNTIIVEETVPPIKTVIVDKIYPYLLALKNI